MAKFQRLIDEGLLSWERETTVVVRTNEWKRCFDALLAYGAIHHHYNVPSHYVVNADDGAAIHLGKWLKDQRYAYRAGKLPFDHLVQLQQLVNQGEMLWEDDSEQLHQFDTMFDMDEPVTKLMRLEDNQNHVSSLSNAIVDTKNNSDRPVDLTQRIV